MKKIKSITSYKKNREIEFLGSLREFDESGNETVFSEFSSDSNVVNRNVSVYNNQGYLIEESHFSEGNEFSEKLIYIRSDKGRIEKTCREYADGSFSITTYNYDRDNGTMEMVTVDEEGEVERKEFVKTNIEGYIIENAVTDFLSGIFSNVHNEYNENGKVSQQRELDENGQIIVVNTFEYDSNHNLIKYQSKSANGELMEETTAIYDDKSRVLEQTVKGNYTADYEYIDDSGCITETRSFPSGQIFYKKLSVIDVDGNLLEESTMGDYIRYEYQFY